MANVSVASPASERFVAHLTTASGRTNRAKFWLAILIYAVIYAIAFGVVYVAGLEMTGPGFAIIGVVGLVLTVSYVLVSIRRLHDRDKSGHWLWLLFGVPAVLNVAANAFVMTNPEAVVTGDMGVLIFLVLVTLVSLGFAIWAIVWLGCLRGTEGPNRFGPDPLQA
jgi:uncharacterized membrane protein YhaH (DUF805 family)